MREKSGLHSDMKLLVISILLVVVEFVSARPSLFARAQERKCAVKWTSSFQTDELSNGNCVYSDSQDKCEKGISMAVDEKICPKGTSMLRFFVEELADRNCSRKS